MRAWFIASPTTGSSSPTQGSTISQPCSSGNSTCSTWRKSDSSGSLVTRLPTKVGLEDLRENHQPPTLGIFSALSTMVVMRRWSMASSSEKGGLNTSSEAFTTSSMCSTYPGMREWHESENETDKQLAKDPWIPAGMLPGSKTVYWSASFQRLILESGCYGNLELQQ